jgi:hypothetical protein
VIPRLGVRNDARGWTPGWLDRVGVAGSMLCAAHCLVAPILVAALPVVAGHAEWMFTIGGLGVVSSFSAAC